MTRNRVCSLGAFALLINFFLPFVSSAYAQDVQVIEGTFANCRLVTPTATGFDVGFEETNDCPMRFDQCVATIPGFANTSTPVVSCGLEPREEVTEPTLFLMFENFRVTRTRVGECPAGTVLSNDGQFLCLSETDEEEVNCAESGLAFNIISGGCFVPPSPDDVAGEPNGQEAFDNAQSGEGDTSAGSGGDGEIPPVDFDNLPQDCLEGFCSVPTSDMAGCAAAGGSFGQIGSVDACVITGDFCTANPTEPLCGSSLVPSDDPGDDPGNTPGNEPGDTNRQATAGGDCSEAPPTCSGDPIECAMLFQDRTLACQGEELNPAMVEQQLAGDMRLTDSASFDAEGEESFVQGLINRGSGEDGGEEAIGDILAGLLPPTVTGRIVPDGCFPQFREWNVSFGSTTVDLRLACRFMSIASTLLYISTYLTAGWILFDSLRGR